MDNLFKTFQIRFTDRNDFIMAILMNNLSDDISHSDMILTYSNEFFRDRFVGFLKMEGITNIEDE